MLEIEIAYGLTNRQGLHIMRVEEGTTVRQATLRSPTAERFPDVDLNIVPPGIFGKVVKDSIVLRAYDRIKVYRPLPTDPRGARRRRVQDEEEERQAVWNPLSNGLVWRSNMPKIKLIAGLSNPDREYEQARHNADFWFLNELAWQWRASFKDEKKFFSEAARIDLPDSDVWLLKSMTFIDRSGQAIAALTQFYKIKPEEILAVCDELDTPYDHTKFKLSGGNGGHSGLKDIQARLGAPNYYRLRSGIDHPGDRNLVIGYVLNKPSAEHCRQIDDATRKSLETMPAILAGEWEEAMRFLHGK